ncbi:protein containg PAS domain S-box [Longilinea arvoryzae]|uniref:Protein containg PAS domain S-box n=1 Tax=Longilinea arvoryzae TaxID=360412 RepID=A0A0S7BH32_9CHLR|nr:GAF domain-containing protein [Longilinea arvoryzae]GAP14905.1 protein containg PAS domain S-box [Longilinea arvoryzae]
MTVMASPSKDQPRTQFKRSLARRTVAQLLFLTVIPFLLMAGFSMFRLRAQLEQQITAQVLSMSNYYTEQLTDLVQSRGDSLSELINDSKISANLPTVITSKARDSKYFTARYSIQGDFYNYTGAADDQEFDQLVVLRSDGSVAFSTARTWENQNFGEYSFLAPFMDKDSAQLVYNPQPLYSDQFVMITSRIIRDEKGQHIGTIFGTTLTSMPISLLNYAETLLPSARSFYYTYDKNLIGFETGTKNIADLKINNGQRNIIESLIAQGSDKLHVVQSMVIGKETFSLAKQVKELNTYFILSIPTETIFSQIQVFSPTTILIFFLATVLIGLAIYFGANQIVRPLEKLSAISQQFSRGDWSQRANVNRNDELGLLSFSFNQMADNLQDLYRSLEAKVEQRSHQLRMASEVALLATSGTSRDDMIRQTVDLLKDRFGYFYSAIYLLDETGDTATLRAASTTDKTFQMASNLRVLVGSHSVIGQVSVSRTPMIVSNLNEERVFKQADSVMANSMSEITVPMILGNDLLGIIDVQSDSLNAFDSDTLTVLETLANQLATGLRNVLLVESSQVNLEETAMLYRSSRQITQSKNETEVVQILTESLSKTHLLAMVLSVEADNLKVISFSDPKTSIVDVSLQGISLPLQRGATYLTEDTILIIDDLQKPGDFENLTAFLARRGCLSVALIPVLENGLPSKLIALGTRESTPLTSSRLQPIASLAEVASTSLDRFAVLETLQERLNELQTLDYVGQAVSAETDTNQLCRILYEIVTDQMGADLDFEVAIYDAKTDQVDIPYQVNDGKLIPASSFPIGEGLISFILNNRKPLLLNKDAEERIQSLGIQGTDPMPRSWLGIPLIVAGNMVGAIVLQDLEKENRFDQADLNLLNTIAPQFSSALRNAQLIADIADITSAYTQEHYLFETLLSNISDRISFKDKDLHYMRVSYSMARDFGYRRSDDFTGKNDIQVMGEELGIASMEQEKQILVSGQPILDEVEKLIDAQNGENWRVITKIPMANSKGDTVGLLGISRDITNVKKAEELAQTRAQHLLTASEIARDTSGLLDLDELLKNAVNMVLDRFGFYHSSIFLLDPLGEYAVLRESTGDAGARMKSIGHNLAVGSNSIVGQVTASGEPVVVNEVRKYEHYYPNPLLPDTRAEMAIPLKGGGRVLGALDIQSTKINAFSQEDVQVLRILADQLAIAIINAELYTSTQETLAQHRFLHQISAAASSSQNVEDALRTTAQGMRVARKDDRISIHILNDRNELVLSASAGYPAGQNSKGIIPVGEGIIGRVAQDKHSIRVGDVQNDPYYIPTDESIRSELAVPIIYTDRLFGVLNLENTKVVAYSENDEEILSTLAANLGSIIANARLVSQVQHQIERQRQIFEITSKIRRSVDMNSILETSTGELCKALWAQKATIRLAVDMEQTEDNSGELTPSKINGSKSNGKGAKE